MSLRFVPPEPLQGHGVAEAGTRSDSVPRISGLDSPRLDGEDIGAVAAMPPAGKTGSADLCSWGFVGENRQCRLFDEHGLDAGLSRPGRKSHRGDTLTKQRWFRHGGQCWNRQRR